MQGCVVRSLQQFSSASPRDAAAVLAEPRRQVAAERGNPGAVVTVDETGFPARVGEVVAALPAPAWRRVASAEGSQGPMVWDYAELTVWVSGEGLPSGPDRLLVRRSIGQEPELKYHRANTPAAVPLAEPAGVRSERWGIEQDFRSAKGRAGWTSTRRGG